MTANRLLKSCATPPVKRRMRLHLLGIHEVASVRSRSLARPLLDPAFQFVVTSLEGVACITQGGIGRRPFRTSRQIVVTNQVDRRANVPAISQTS